MRSHLIALAAATLVALSTPVSAQSIEFGPGGIRIDDGRGRGRGGPDCGELRAACLNKDRLGEQGEGNCRRYRNLCRGGGERGASRRGFSGEGNDGGNCRVITRERTNAYGETVVRRTRVCD